MRFAIAEVQPRVQLSFHQKKLLPFHAIAGRITISVPDELEFIDLETWPEFQLAYLGVIGGRRTAFDSIKSGIISRWQHSELRQDRYLNALTKVRLQRGESVSCSFVLAALWDDPIGGLYGAHPIFDRIGKYELLWSFKRFPPRIFESFRIDVESPQGDDSKIYLLIKRDKLLREAILSSTNHPDPEAALKLKDIVEKYPTSAYADYARFALARALVVNERTLEASRKDFLESKLNHVTSIPDPASYRPQDLALDMWEPYPLRGIRKDAVVAVMDARQKNAKNLSELVERLVDLSYPTENDRKVAISLLKSIDHKNFPYGANALLLLRNLQLNLHQAEEADRTFDLIDEYWHDHGDCLAERAYTITEWAETKSEDDIASLSSAVSAWRSYRVRPLVIPKNE